MKEKLKKQLSILLTVSTLFFYVAYPTLAFAQEVTPTDTPTPTPATTTVDNNAATSTDVNAVSDTGDNSIGATPTPTPSVDPSPTPTDTPTDTPTPTPSVDPSPTPTDTPTPTTDISNNAQVSNDSQSTANTGNNSIDATPSASDNSAGPDSNHSCPSSPTLAIDSGNATSATSVVNDVNATLLNSTVVNQTLNIFVAQSGSIDLSDPFTIAADAVQTHPNDAVINVSFTNINNYTYLSNNISSLANTGNNTVNAPGQTSAIATGNAYSTVSLLNQVNFNVVNSQIHLITINIFGTLNGNIILPDPNASTNCSDCGVSTNLNNTADVTNNLSSSADTGNNSVVTSGNATITSGNAQSTVNNLNLVNANVLGANVEVLYINDLGTWNGNFIGWGNFDPTAGGASLVFYNFSSKANAASGCPTCSTQTNINNTAYVQNDVSSLANSGGNSISGGNSSISTGNSFSAISLMNFINSNFLNSFGFFGFINIFGNWTGNIGGAAQFAALNVQNNNSGTPPSNDSVTNADSTAVQDLGGQLSVTNANNVGAFVYPGDTVTFFINVKNTGTGKVYGTSLKLSLIYQGQNVGGATINIGDIQPGKTAKVSTGFVLTKTTPPGKYIARAVAVGNVGPDNSSVSASSDSFFTVFGNALTFLTNSKGNNPKVAVLGSQNRLANKSFAQQTQAAPFLYLLLLGILLYVIIRLLKNTNYVFVILSSRTFKEKIYFLKILLL